MNLSLLHNGYNVERRKMYPYNPRNNLISTVDVTWRESLQNEKQWSTNLLKAKKEEETAQIASHYTKSVQLKLEEQFKMDKSSFRVLPQSVGKEPKSNIRDSLQMEVANYNLSQSRTRAGNGSGSPTYNPENSPKYREEAVQIDLTPRQPIQNSSLLSKSVFGYQLNYQNYNRESYFSKLLSDRLQPYLNKHSPSPSADKKQPKYRSFTINTPVPNYYEAK